MTTLPILYSFRRCPYAMRARIALAYTQQHVELREVVLKDKPPSLLEYSAKGTVPVLIDITEGIIEESLDIMLWSLAQHDPDQWLNNLAEQQKLIAENDNIFKAKLDHYKYAERFPEHSEHVYRERCYPFLDMLNARLEKHDCLYSEQYCLADMAIFPFIRQFAHVDLAWFDTSHWHHLKAWLNRLKSCELFSHVMTKYPAWHEGDTPTLF